MFVLCILILCNIHGDSNVYAYVTPEHSKDLRLYSSSSAIYTENVSDQIREKGSKNEGQCKLFSGTWVHDTSYPLYNAAECPYISTQTNCRANGRPDSDYEKWRWQPDGCTIPRFNAMDMLERMRGKRLMFVGDSINKGQFESMACLLQAVIPSNKKSMVNGTLLTRFKALDYNASVEMFWAPFLVELETNNHGKNILNLDSIENYGMVWKGADILVFESSHWWDHTGGSNGTIWDIVTEGNKTYSNIDRMVAYRKALTKWANWTNSHIDFGKTLVFFNGMAPRHFSCDKETEPLQNASSYKPPLPPQVKILKQVLTDIKFPLVFMNITPMSVLRQDAHPSSMYGGDCSHWCLPGVPDSWNQLLYASL